MLDTAITDASGFFTLNAGSSDRPYYHIVETDPPGYSSTGVQAGTGGIEVNYNWIRYQNPAPGTHDGNLFWDHLPATQTPTTTSTCGGRQSMIAPRCRAWSRRRWFPTTGKTAWSAR